MWRNRCSVDQCWGITAHIWTDHTAIKPQVETQSRLHLWPLCFSLSLILGHILPQKTHLCPTCHLCQDRWVPRPSTHRHIIIIIVIKQASLQNCDTHKQCPWKPWLTADSHFLSDFISYPTDFYFHIRLLLPALCASLENDCARTTAFATKGYLNEIQLYKLLINQDTSLLFPQRAGLLSLGLPLCKEIKPVCERIIPCRGCPLAVWS